jgi:hypothetical protein
VRHAGRINKKKPGAYHLGLMFKLGLPKTYTFTAEACPGLDPGAQRKALQTGLTQMATDWGIEELRN